MQVCSHLSRFALVSRGSRGRNAKKYTGYCIIACVPIWLRGKDSNSLKGLSRCAPVATTSGLSLRAAAAGEKPFGPALSTAAHRAGAQRSGSCAERTSSGGSELLSLRESETIRSLRGRSSARRPHNPNDRGHTFFSITAKNTAHRTVDCVFWWLRGLAT